MQPIVVQAMRVSTPGFSARRPRAAWGRRIEQFSELAAALHTRDPLAIHVARNEQLRDGIAGFILAQDLCRSAKYPSGSVVCFYCLDQAVVRAGRQLQRPTRSGFKRLPDRALQRRLDWRRMRDFGKVGRNQQDSNEVLNRIRCMAI